MFPAAVLFGLPVAAALPSVYGGGASAASFAAVSSHDMTAASMPGLDRSMSLGGKCRQVTLAGAGKVGKTTLEGRCVDSRGQWWSTALNLNECVGGRDGKLVYQDEGHFDDICRPCLIDETDDRSGVDLKCNCLDARGMPQYTFLRMGEHAQGDIAVKVVEGRFVCGRHEGIGSPSFE
ncbi:cyanovirin-n domain-containing protein [Metarhizium rileyi]|uniref:Cyanovirin-n domain-containing protein n=1 Tax=Metarhizium rileyi (strain RCEF 4871) TaxID=1649241 RepID=A0A167HE94_METRR|nr:cyanovirin-n domain-containing protein [Metarhizium rileyi RCEF 4871]TWU76420.1 hypothetical protein ED733_006858 [Metarhizium rileyi]